MSASLRSLVVSGRARWYVAGGALVILAVVVVVVVVVWLVTDRADPPRERRYRDITVCLLTDARGIAARPASVVWAGMQDASLETLAKVQYLSVAGDQTPQNATLFLNSLGQGGCAVVLAVGDGPVGAVAAGAATFPGVHFVVVGGQAAKAPNVSTVDVSDDNATRARVTAVMTAMVGPNPSD